MFYSLRIPLFILTRLNLPIQHFICFTVNTMCKIKETEIKTFANGLHSNKKQIIFNICDIYFISMTHLDVRKSHICYNFKHQLLDECHRQVYDFVPKNQHILDMVFFLMAYLSISLVLSMHMFLQ